MIEQPTSRIEEGEENYRKFWKSYSQANATLLRKNRPEFVTSAGSLEKNNEIRAVFLGVKPSALLCNDFENINFEKYGLKKIGDFLYDEELANQVISKNKDIFNDVENAQEFFEKIKEDQEKNILINRLGEKFKIKRNNTSWKKICEKGIKKELQTGLLLGFPRLSSEKFAKNSYSYVPKEAKKIRHAVGSIAWVSFPEVDQTEDEKFKRILEKSFAVANKL